MAYTFKINGSGGQYTVDFNYDEMTLFTTYPVASADQAKALIETIRMQAPNAGIEGAD